MRLKKGVSFQPSTPSPFWVGSELIHNCEATTSIPSSRSHWRPTRTTSECFPRFEIPIVIVAVSLRRYSNGDWAQRTDWHKVVVFKPSLRDSVLKYLTKGQRTLITGKISYSEIVDDSGNKRQATNVIADDVIYLTK